MDYTVTFEVEKTSPETEIYVGTGLTGTVNGEFISDKVSLHEYCIGCGANGTGLKVLKDGKEGYTMGDYSSSVFAGNLRACFDEEVKPGDYTVTVAFGSDEIHCSYSDGTTSYANLDCKLETYNRDVFHSVTKDAEHVYIKLVNADCYDKKVKINLNNIKTTGSADVVTLTGDAELVHKRNVNTRDAELIQPVESKLSVGADGFEITLLADSVTVVIL